MSNQTIAETKEALRLAYCASNQSAQDSIKGIVGGVFGKVKVTAPVEFNDRGYECAAWSETRISGTGVFDVTLRQDPYDKNRLFFQASLPATIQRDYFPALFCGNLIGKPYDVNQNSGKPCRDVLIVKDPVDAVSHSSSSDDGDAQKWAILPETYEALLACYRAQLTAALDYQAYATFIYETEADDKYLSKVGQVGYIAGRVNALVKGIQELARAIDSRKQGGTDYFAKNNPFAV